MKAGKLSRRASVVALAIAVSILSAPTAMAHGEPTCSDLEFLEIEVHGDHVKRDYVFQEGETNAAGGAKLPGGPGPRFHFPNLVAPGASFCTDANSGVIYTNNPTLAP